MRATKVIELINQGKFNVLVVPTATNFDSLDSFAVVKMDVNTVVVFGFQMTSGGKHSYNICVIHGYMKAIQDGAGQCQVTFRYCLVGLQEKRLGMSLMVPVGGFQGFATERKELEKDGIRFLALA
jgi:hypothetical protein